jgi:hypothetical protein
MKMKKLKAIQSNSEQFRAKRIPTSRTTTILAFVAIGMSWCVTSMTASAATVDINGGSSWGGWTLRGNSRDVGIWAQGSTTRNYDLYTTVFEFNNNAITGSPTQVKTPSAPGGFTAGTFSPGSFATGNLILGIGLKMKDVSASAIGTTFLNFGIGGNNYQAASSLGGTDGRYDNTVWGHTGDFSMWMDGTGNGPSNLNAMTTNGTATIGGTGASSDLAGGFGSGVSYDYAARMFRQGGAGGTIQFFFDLTAMETLYGPGSPSIGAGWNPTTSARIGDIGSSLNLVMYNSNSGFANGSQVVIGPIAVPEPSTSVLGAISIGALAFVRRRAEKDEVVR